MSASLLWAVSLLVQDQQPILVSHAASLSQVTGRDITYASRYPAPPYETVAVGSLVIGSGAYSPPSLDYAPLWLRASDGSERRLEPAGLVNGRPIRYRIPLATPLGLASIRDQAGSMQTIMIAARSFELFPDGMRAEGELINVARPALVGQRVTLDGTGLGASPAEAQVTLRLGDLTLRPSVAAVAGQPGLDRLEFVVPPGVPLSCYLGVLVDVDGESSVLPLRHLATAAPGAVCPQATGITQEDLIASQTRRCVPAVVASAYTSAGQAYGPLLRDFSASAAFSSLSVPYPLWAVRTPVGVCRGEVRQLRRGLSFAVSPGGFFEEDGQRPPSCSLPTGDLQLFDSQNRPVSNQIQQASSWEQLPDAPFPSGIWRLRWADHEWPVPVILLRWLNRGEADSLTRDREYVVRWDTAPARPGDLVELTISGFVGSRAYMLHCAAEATKGTLVLPPGALWEMPPDFSGQPGYVGLQLVRPTEIWRLTSGPARYLIFSNSSQESRPITLP